MNGKSEQERQPLPVGAADYTGNPLEPKRWLKITDIFGGVHIVWGKPIASGWEGSSQKGGLIVTYFRGLHTGESIDEQSG